MLSWQQLQEKIYNFFWSLNANDSQIMSSSDKSQTSKSLCLFIPGAIAHWWHFIGDTSTGGTEVSLSELLASSSDGKANISGEGLGWWLAMLCFGPLPWVPGTGSHCNGILDCWDERQKGVGDTDNTLLSIQGTYTQNNSNYSKNIYFTHGYLQIVQVVTRIHQLDPNTDGLWVYPGLSDLWQSLLQKTSLRWSSSVPPIVPDRLQFTVAHFGGKKLDWTKPLNTTCDCSICKKSKLIVWCLT